MTMETFVQIINISLVVLFIGIIAGLLIAIFRGMKRGIWKATYKLFFILALFLGAIFSLGVLAKYVGNFDISVFKIPDLKFSGKAEYVVVFDSTLKEGAYEIVKGLLISQGLPYNAQAAELAYALAESIVKFITFFVEIIVIVIVGNLIASLLWHILFKHFIPKIVRKRVKIKAVSSIETVLKYVVTTFMMLAPLTALVNTVNVAYQRNKRGNTDGVMAYIDSFLNAYDDSLFAKVFFSWTVNDQGLSFDASFMNTITTSTYQEGTVGFVESLYDLTSIAALTGQAVTINTDGSTPTITWTIALEGEFVGSLIDLLINSKLITYILPIAAELGLSLIDDPNIEDKIDLDAINWKEELTALKELYQSLYNAGFADYVLTEDGQLQSNYVVEDLLESIISNDNQFNTIVNAIASLDDHQIIKQAIPYAVYYLVEKNRDDEGNTTLGYLPDTWEEIKSVTWCDDLCLVLKTAKRMYDVNPDVLHQVFDLTKNDSSAAMLSAKFADGDDKIENLIGTIAQNLDKYVPILVGQRSDSDPYELANLDEYGKTVLPGGKETDTVYETIFDASLMKYAVRYIPTLLEGKEDIPEEVSQTLVDLNDDCWRLNYKEELNAMLHCLEVVSGKPDEAKEIYSTIKQMTGSGTDDILSLITDSMVHVFSTMLPRTDHSRILNSFAYPYAKKYVEEFNFNEKLGLSNEIIQFAVNRACDERRLGAALVPVVDSFSSIKVIMDDLDITLNSSNTVQSHRIRYASEVKDQIKLLAEHYLDVNNVLNAFYNCDLINPVLSIEEINETGFMQDENYVNLISYIYNLVTDLGLDTVKSLVLDAEVSNWIHENMMISLAIKAVGESDIISLLDEEMSNALLIQLSEKVEDVFMAIGDSASFSMVMGPYLDKTLNSLSDSILTDGVCFSNVTDWKLEASKMKVLMETLGNSSFDINNLDLTGANNVVDLNNLLHALQDSTIFKHVEADGSVTQLFSIWAYNKVYSFLDEFKDGAGNTYALGTDPTSDPTLSDYPHHYLKKDFLSVDDSEWYGSGFVVKESSLFDDPDFYNKYIDILDADELGRVSKVVYWANKISSDSGSSSIMELDAEYITNTLKALNDSKVLRIGVYNFYKIAQDRFENDFLNLKAANLSYLLDCGQGAEVENTLELRELRKVEVDVFCDLYSELKKVNDEGIIDLDNNTVKLELIDDELADNVTSLLDRIVVSHVFHADGPEAGSGQFTVLQGILVKTLEALDNYNLVYNSASPKDVYFRSAYEAFKESTDTIGQGKIKYLIDKYFNYVGANVNPDEQREYIHEALEIVRAGLGLTKGDGSAKYIGIRDKNGEITTSFDNYDLADPAFLTAVRQVLENVQKSVLLEDISLNGIKVVLDEADSMIEGFDNLKFSSANVYYSYGVQNVTGVDFSGCNWDTGIQDEDIEILLYLIEQVGLYQKEDANCDIPIIDDISSDLSKIKSEGIKNILNMLFDSSMFHKAGPAVKLTPSGSGFIKSYVNEEVIDTQAYNFTVAQSLIKEILTIDDIKALYYVDASPKDQYSSKYMTAEGKVAYNVSTIFAYDGSVSHADIEDEIIKVTNFVEVVKDLGSLDFDSFDYSDDEFINTVEDALLTARESKILKDLPLNVINRILEEADSMVDGFENVKFSNANVYHVYGVQDKTDFDKCDWEATITDDDIEVITYLIKQAGLYKKGEPCDIPNINDVSSDLSKLKAEGIKNLLSHLFSSEMFHTSGPAMKLVKVDSAYTKQYVNTESVDGVNYHFTIAQSIMREVLSVDEVKGYYYLDASPKDVYFKLTNVYKSANGKIAYNISRIFPFGPSADNNAIASEIDQIGVFIDRVSKLGSLDLDTFDYSEDSFIDKVGSLLREAGKSELFKDFALNVVHEALIEANDMLSGFNNLKMSDANVYYIYNVQNRADFSLCNWDATIQEEDIEVISYLLKQAGLYDKGSGDSDIPVMDDVNNDLGKLNPAGIKTLLDTLFTSKMFHLEGPAMEITSLTSKQYVNTVTIGGSSYNFTVAQNVMREMLSLDTVKEYYYLTDSPKDQYFAYGSAERKIATNVSTIFPYGVSASSKDIEDEIVNITNFFGKVKNLGSLDIDSFDYSQDDFIQKVRELLVESGKSATFKDFSLNLIYKLLGEADDKLSGFGSVKLSSANVFYAYDIQNKDDFIKCNWNATIQSEDIDVICYLIKQVGLYEKGSANCDIPDIDSLGGDISKIDTAGIKTLFNTLFTSKMFHLEGPAMKITGTNTKAYVNTDVIDGQNYNFTVAQSIMSELLKLNDVKDIYFLADSPKDQYLTSYITADGKIAYNISKIFPFGNAASSRAIEDEILAIVNFIDAVKGIGSLDYSTFDFTSSSFISTVRSVLEKSRESALLKDIPLNLIKKMLSEADGKLSGLSYVKLSSANVYYAYGIQDQTDFSKCNWEASIQDEDIETICYLIEQVGLYEKHNPDCDIPVMDDINSDLSKIREDGIKNLLNNLFTSKMFHKAGPAMKIVGSEKQYINNETVDGHDYSFTVAQDLVREILGINDVKSIYFLADSPKDIYSSNYSSSDGKIAYNVTSIFPYGSSASSKDIEDEIIGITNFVGAIKGVGGLDTDDYDFADDHFVDTVRDILTKAREPRILRDFPLNLIKKMLTEADTKLTDLTYVKLADANVYYAYGIQDETDFSKCDWDATITDNDIDTICYLVKQVGLYENNNADCDIPVIANFSDDLDKVNTEGIKNLLSHLFNSEMFHKSGQAMELIVTGSGFTKAYVDKETIDGHDYMFTVAQGMIREIIGLDKLKEIYYMNSTDYVSPKDQDSLDKYVTSNGKIAYNVTSVFPYGASASETLMNKEINAIGDFVDALKEFGTVDVGGLDFASTDPAATGKLLHAANKSDLLMDLVPNSLNKIFVDMGTGSDLSNLVDFADADTFYHYRTSTTPNYNAKFPSNEIDNISELMHLYQVLVGPDGLDGGDIDKFSNFNRLIRKGHLWNILVALHDSEVMHGQSQYKLKTEADAQKLKDAETVYDDEIHMTVFEQVINMMIETSSISKFIYQYENSLTNEQADALDPVTSYRYETMIKIKKISCLEIKGIAESSIFADYAGYNKDWVISRDKDSSTLDELHALYNFLGKAMNAMGGDLNIAKVSLVKSGMDPDEVEDLLYSLNKVDTISKTVEVIIYKGFESMKLIEYTKYYGEMKAKFDLGQEGYGGKVTDFDIPERLAKTEIHLVKELLYNLSYKNPDDNNKRNLYYDFEDIQDLAKHIESLDGAMTYMKNSAIFALEFNPEHDASVDKLNGRSLLMANIFKSVPISTGGSKENLLDYFVGATYEQKILNIYKIFNFDSIDFKTLAEAQGVHYLLKNAEEVQDITSITTGGGYDVNKISAKLGVIHNLMDDCTFVIDGQECRSFFVSQIVGETLNDILVQEEDIINSTYGSDTYILVRFGPATAQEVTAAAYNDTIFSAARVSIPVNDAEADGLTASLEAITHMSNIAVDYITKKAMASGGPVPIESLNTADFAKLHNNFKTMGKSYVARVLYLSRMHKGVTQLAAEYTDWQIAINQYVGNVLTAKKLYQTSFTGFGDYSTGLGWHLF